MSELSIFIDESGDVGEYRHHSPYYIITMVFRDQDDDITQYKDVFELEARMAREISFFLRENGNLSRSEQYVFGSKRDFYKDFINRIRKKQLSQE